MKKIFLKKTIFAFFILSLGFAMGTTLKFATAWIEPSGSSNIVAPLNSSSVGQSKLGGLILNVGSSLYGLIVQNGLVGIGTTAPQGKLDVSSTDSGFLPPRMTEAQKTAIGNPSVGTIIYNTTSDEINVYKSTGWSVVGGGGGGVPTGTIAYFDLAACPSGWTEVTDARGRYIVGLPSGGTLGAGSVTGTALSNKENRATGAHSHPLNDPGHSHPLTLGGVGSLGPSYIPAGTYASYSYPPTYNGRSVAPTGSSSTGISISNPVAPNNIPDTNAPYIQYLACKKN